MRAGSAPVRAPVPRAPLADLKIAVPGNGNSNGHAHASPAPLAYPQVPAVHAAGGTTTEDTPRRWSTLWPLLVAIIAIAAILASVAMLMFGGNGEKKTSKAKRFEGPAPDLMPTDPGAHTVPPGSPHAPDPVPPSAGPVDPGAVPAPSGPTAGRPGDVHEFMAQAVETGCRRMTSCNNNDPTISAYCSMAPQMLSSMKDSLETMCPDFDGSAAGACVASIGRLPCPSGNADPGALAQTLMGLTDCQKVCASAFGSMNGTIGGSIGDLTGPNDDDPDDADDPDDSL
jgi:hypothetical protein